MINIDQLLILQNIIYHIKINLLKKHQFKIHYDKAINSCKQVYKSVKNQHKRDEESFYILPSCIRNAHTKFEVDWTMPKLTKREKN